MNLLGVGEIVKNVSDLADDLFTSDEERLKIALEEQKIKSTLIQEQTKVNLAEAQHPSIFVAGWRPFIGWMGGFALAYQFIIYPFLVWGWALGQAKGWIPCTLNGDEISNVCTFNSPPVFDTGPLFAIITGMLGIGGLRTYDKIKQTDTKVMKKSNKKIM